LSTRDLEFFTKAPRHCIWE